MVKLLPVVLAVLFMVSITSCSDDNDYYCGGPYDNSQGVLYEMVQTLRGRWTGKTAAHFKDPDGLLREGVYDADVEFDIYDSNSRGGHGRQMDYFSGEMAYDRTFLWAIDSRSGDIIVTYDGESRERFQMIINFDGIKLDNHIFSGVMVGTGESDEFSYARYTYAKKVTMDFKE